MAGTLNKILGFGVTPDMPFRLQNKIRIFNAASIITGSINAFYGVVGLFIGWYFASVISVISVLLLGFGWYMIRKKWYVQTFHLIMIYAFVFLICYSYLFGEGTQSYLYFLFLPAAVTIMFERRSVMVFYLFVTIACIFIVKWMFRQHISHYSADKDLLGIFGYTNTIFTLLLIFTGVSQFKKENQAYAGKVELQKQFIEEKNKEITDSINYAGRIQKAIMPSAGEFISCFRDAFVLLKPRDIVSGDFYWITRRGNRLFFAAADCTGHGVPGGFMTMLGLSFLEEIVNEKNEADPGRILDHLREKIISALRQTGATGESKDGMDLVLCRLEEGGDRIAFSGANNSLYLLHAGGIEEHKGNKQPCGFYHETLPFTTREAVLGPGSSLYLFTDGFPDQFGGARGKKFKYRQLEEKILSLKDVSMKEQERALNDTFMQWKGNFEQVDDVLVIGIRT